MQLRPNHARDSRYLMKAGMVSADAKDEEENSNIHLVATRLGSSLIRLLELAESKPGLVRMYLAFDGNRSHLAQAVALLNFE